MNSDCGYMGNGTCPLCDEVAGPEVSDFWKWIQGSSCIPYQDDPTPDELIEVRYLYHEKEGLRSQATQLRTSNTRLQALAEDAIKERDKAVARELEWTARAEAAELHTVNQEVQDLVQKIWNENQDLRKKLTRAEESLAETRNGELQAVRISVSAETENENLRCTLRGYENYVEQLEQCFKEIGHVMRQGGCLRDHLAEAREYLEVDDLELDDDDDDQ